MAKSIQNQIKKALNPAVLAMLGWREILAQIDVIKLNFVRRILALAATNIYRIMMVRRIFYLLSTGIAKGQSPVAQILRCLNKYNLANKVLEFIDRASVPNKTD